MKRMATLSLQACFLILFLGALLSTTNVFAQTSTEERSAPTSQMNSERGEIRMNQSERQMRREMLSEKMQERIINLVQNVSNRLTAAMNRMKNIIERLDTRITKLKALGIDTTLVEAKLTEAKSTLADGREKFEALTPVRTAITGDTPRESFITVRTKLVTVRDSIRQTHTLLKEVLVLLKEVIQAAELKKEMDAGTNDESSVRRDLQGSTTPHNQ